MRFGRTLALPMAFAALVAGVDANAQDEIEPNADVQGSANAVPDEETFSIEVVYTADVWANVDGGRERGVRYLHNIDLIAGLDAERAFGWNGVALHAHAIHNLDTSISELVGDFQAVSNIETGVEATRLLEAWAAIDLGSTASLKVGLYDLNSEFDAIEAAGIFLNSSHGIGAEFAASGASGPSIFPVTSLAMRVDHEFAPGWTVRAVALDAVPGNPLRPKRTAIDLSSREGALLVGEVEYTGPTSRVAAGHWRYTADQPRILNDDENGTSQGAYVLAEGLLAGASETGGSALFGFARAGIAEAATNPVARYFGAGLNVVQPFGWESEHALGVAVSWAEFGRPLRLEEGLEQREVTFELTYRHQISRHIAVQPDIQYVISPSGAPELGDALVLGLRVSFGL